MTKIEHCLRASRQLKIEEQLRLGEPVFKDIVFVVPHPDGDATLDWKLCSGSGVSDVHNC
jgi:hypothetical protein